jgi:chromosome segregation ATPase
MSTIDEQLAECRAELERARARHREAAERLGDCSSDPHQFDRARRERDRLAREVERLELRGEQLEQRWRDQTERAKAERQRALEAEAEALDQEITARAVAGKDLALRIAAILREIEQLRERAMAVNQRLNPTQVYPVAAEPEELYRALAGCTNAARRACTFSKMGLETERQLPLPEGKDHGDQAAA